MKALYAHCTALAAAAVLVAVSSAAMAQNAPRGGGSFQGPPRGGGAFQGSPSPGGAFRGGPAPRADGGYRGEPPPGGAAWGGPVRGVDGYRGGAPPGGSYRAGPSHGGRPGHVPPRTNIYVGVHGPGFWWGSGTWWGPTWWGPGPWWGPGRWWGPGFWWGPGVWPGWSTVVWPVTGVVVPQQIVSQPIFIERDAPAAPVWWYWCPEATAYYPYVQECPGGWQRVAPQEVAPPNGAVERVAP